MKATRTWILIADGARARVLLAHGHNPRLEEVPGMTFAGEHTATHEMVRDRQGRSFSSVGDGRSAIEGHTDPHRELKREFAQRLAAAMARGLDAGSFDRLVVVAPAHTLGDLRDALSPAVKAKIGGEVVKDLTKTPDDELASHLTDVL